MPTLPYSLFIYGGRVGMSPLSSHGTLTYKLVSGTAYFVYIGLAMGETTVPKFVQFFVTNTAPGSQTCEIGIFSSADAPNASPVTLTKVAASNSLTAMNSLGLKKNLVAFTTPLVSLVHLWAGIRVATTGPTVQALGNDWGYGFVSILTGAPPLTGAGPFIGTPFPSGAFLGAPDLRVSLD
jgi:hypothetical protein